MISLMVQPPLNLLGASLSLAGDGLEYGRAIGAMLPSTLCLIGLVKAIQVYRRPTANKKCVLSVAIFLGFSTLWMVLLGLQATKVLPQQRSLAALFGVIALFGFLLAGLLAVIGLLEVRARPADFKEGRGQAISTLILSAGFLMLAGMGFYSRIKKGEEVPPDWKRTTSQGPSRFEDLNFEFAAPEAPWAELNAKKVNPVASLAFVRSNPQVYFMVIAEKVEDSGAAQLESYVELVKGNARTLSPAARFHGESPAKINGFDGHAMSCDLTTGGQGLAFDYRILARQGYLYQLIAWREARYRDQTLGGINTLFSKFKLIDPARTAEKPAGTPVGEFRSPAFGYGVDLTGAGWTTWDAVAEMNPPADFGALKGAYGGFLARSVSLLGHDPSPEQLAHGLFQRLEIRYPNDEFTDVVPFEEGGYKGFLCTIEKSLNNQDYVYRFKFVKGAGFGYLFAAWVPKKEQGRLAEVAESLSRVRLGKTGPPDPSGFTLRQKRLHGLVFNDMGLLSHAAKDFAQAARYFIVAFESAGDDAVILGNVVEALSQGERPGDALQYLVKHLGRFPKDRRMAGLQAALLERLGRREEAIAAYAGIFLEGFVDDGLFADYATLLWKKGPPDEALKVVDRYLERTPSIAVAIHQATLLADGGDLEGALRFLRKRQEGRPYQSEIAYALGDVLNQAGRHTEVLEVCSELVANRFSTARTHFTRGRSEYALKWYRQAKESFEAALKKDPAHPEAGEFLEEVSAALGEGSNSTIKEPIEAVALPGDPPLPSAVPEDRFKDVDAYYLRKARAVSYLKDLEFRSTDTFVVKVLNVRGVSRFSSFRFSFDPLTEGIYVNRMEVRDAQGSVVGRGNVSDYFVLDGGTPSMATGDKILNIPVEGLRPGCLVELVVTRRDLRPGPRPRFIEHALSGSLPILQSILAVRGDVDQIRHHAFSAPQPKATPGGIVWQMDSPPVFVRESLQAPFATIYPLVWTGDKEATWTSLGADYLSSIQGVISKDSEAARQAESIVKDLKRDSEKILALARHVQRELVYKAIEFGRRARVPQETGEILKKKFGDCKDHALLLHQFLKASGIPSALVLVNSSGGTEPAVPSLDQFDHMIVHVPALGGAGFIDCTDKDTDPGLGVPYGLSDRHVLVLDPARPRLDRIGHYPEGSNTVTIERELRAAQSGDASVRETVRFGGYSASTMRDYLRSIEAAERKQRIQQRISMEQGRAELEELEIQDLEDTGKPLILKVMFRVPGLFQSVGDHRVGRISAPWARDYITLSPAVERKTAIQVYFPLQMTVKTLLLVPAGHGIESTVVGEQGEDTPYAGWKTACHVQSGKLEIAWSFRQSPGLHPASAFSAYREVHVNALNTLEPQIAFKKTP